MKQAITISFVLLLLGMNVSWGQDDDTGRIALNAVVFEQAFELPKAVERQLENKLKQICTKNGMGGQSFDGRFIITAEINVLAKEITATAPPMHAITTETTIYIGDGFEGTLFASASISGKGVGNTEAKAYTMALKQIKPNSDELQALVETGKERIVEYYNSRCDFIMGEVDVLVSSQEYDAAVAKCLGIPEVCKECYMKGVEKAKEAFQKKIDLECKTHMNEAQAVWAASLNPEGAEEAAKILAQINPESSCAKEASAFMDAIYQEIKDRMEELDRREWEMKVKQQEDAVKLEQSRIDAIKEIGKAYASAPRNYTYVRVY